eukprot:TRINITY_DN12796_c0_g1_i1.p3 TRINITY_DN12796_c0_g1~~TRINITY_DN12796_c0_g1_i1.p3  ORF type:complete len:106 (+),score=10.51 TRINITY_DN12796_c0_g1_i1:123-440(+)
MRAHDVEHTLRAAALDGERLVARVTVDLHVCGMLVLALVPDRPLERLAAFDPRAYAWQPKEKTTKLIQEGCPVSGKLSVMLDGGGDAAESAWRRVGLHTCGSSRR